MEKTKNTSVYLEEVHTKYIALMSVMTGFNKSEYIRYLIEEDMLENEEIVVEFEKLLF